MAEPDPRVTIWNLLHDGEITAVAGEGTEQARADAAQREQKRRT